MTRSDMIRRLRKRNPSMRLEDIEFTVKKLTEILTGAIASGDRVEFRRFGVFSMRERRPRIARNPRTGAPVKIGKRFAVHFKPGSRLRDEVQASARSELARKHEV